MAIYSIRDLEKLTGIKAHTIRMWEQRYDLIAPARTNTNIRYYTDENLRHLFNVALLNRHGLKISKLAKMGADEIANKVSEIAKNNSAANTQIDALTLAMIDMDESIFQHIFKTYVDEHGFEETIIQLVYPFLNKLNVLWLTNSISPAHEHFISNLIRRKLMCAIDQVSGEVVEEKTTFILYLPDGELQELTLLFVHYLLRKRGQRVVYLGQGNSVGDLRDACQAVRPDYVFTILQEPLPRQSIQSYVDQIAQFLTSGRLLVTGAQVFIGPLKLPENVRVLNGLPDTMQFLDTLQIRQISARS